MHELLDFCLCKRKQIPSLRSPVLALFLHEAIVLGLLLNGSQFFKPFIYSTRSKIRLRSQEQVGAGAAVSVLRCLKSEEVSCFYLLNQRIDLTNWALCGKFIQ